MKKARLFVVSGLGENLCVLKMFDIYYEDNLFVSPLGTIKTCAFSLLYAGHIKLLKHESMLVYVSDRVAHLYTGKGVYVEGSPYKIPESERVIIKEYLDYD